MRNIIVSTVDAERIRQRIMDVRSKTGFSKELKTLQEELENATIVEPHEMPADVLTMNSEVRLKYLNNGKTMQIKIVYPEDADIKTQKVSVFAPIAIALLGYKKGDTVSWTINNLPVRVKIEEIVYQPESVGQYEV
jgi:regulator of nucleoside diphosphate kinase